MLPLTKEQRVKVEENMGLVGKVIGDCVHTLDKGCIYTCDDLFQTGCIGLCKAAQTDRAEATATGTTAKGIRAIRMHIDGYSRKEIGQQIGRASSRERV